ncbi:MAG: N-acetylmuramoyl-L-alanine amidase, partial [Lysobacter sp.]|nr:N-acetylmuramoyl-L-alanine amidase [Lysobacter sp.]
MAGTARVVFELAQATAALPPRIEDTASGPRLVLEWPGDHGAAPSVAATPDKAGVIQPPAAEPTPAATNAASADATSRLIAQMAARTPYPPAPARTAPVSAPTPAPASATAPPAVRTSIATGIPTTMAKGVPTTIATGVPTTIATGVPTTIARGVPAPAAATAPPPAEVSQFKTFEQVLDARSMRPLVIAIDPGHGGQDPGAVGLNGSREKDVVLAISRELARQINATPGLRAFLTRDA